MRPTFRNAVLRLFVVHNLATPPYAWFLVIQVGSFVLILTFILYCGAPLFNGCDRVKYVYSITFDITWRVTRTESPVVIL